MAVENEVDNRHRQERALQVMINEKKSELDRYRLDKLPPPFSKIISCFFFFFRYKAQLNSLRRVEGEYKATLERLNNAHN